MLAAARGLRLARCTGRGGEKLGIGIFLTYLVPPTLLFIPLSRVVSVARACRTRSGRWSSSTRPSPCPFCTWLLMGFFKSVPREIEEAAIVDGCTRASALS